MEKELFALFNRRVFGEALPEDTEIFWSSRLRKTAGRCYSRTVVCGGSEKRPVGGILVGRGEYRVCRIELSNKVIDRVGRLKATLLHEMCHAAAFVVDNYRRPPHGPGFQKWAALASAAFPKLRVTTCHSYAIFYKYRWRCVRSDAWPSSGLGLRDCVSRDIGRHSKSLDTSKMRCGRCGGKLVFLGIFYKDGKSKKSDPDETKWLLQPSKVPEHFDGYQKN